jgi:broad specificity phosphatase PhoE
MSRLILVRHSQASFFADDYDQLSPLGECQARALGDHWLKLDIGFDQIIVGPRKRQIRTEQIVRSVCEANGKPWPQAEIFPEFDEHCVDQLLGEPLAGLVGLHPRLQPLAAEYRSAVVPEQKQRTFQLLFEAICYLWCDGAPGTDSIEPWRDFQARVESGIKRVLEHPGRNRTIVVFTSVGNITAALRFVLGCSPTQALELGWRLKNCSLTELIFSGNRVTLDQFNTLSHLPDPKHWTFR